MGQIRLHRRGRALSGEAYYRQAGEGLSVQMHHHRAEHWVVVAGTARVTINGEVKLLGENESIYIPLGRPTAWKIREKYRSI